MDDQQQDEFERLLEDWTEKRILSEELTAQHVTTASAEAGLTVELPQEVLTQEAYEAISLARQLEQEAWEALARFLMTFR